MSTRRQTFWDDLAEIFEDFPWWVPVAGGFVAAGVVYLVVTLGAPRMIAAIVPGGEVSLDPMSFRGLGLLLGGAALVAFIFAGVRAQWRRAERSQLLRKSDSLASIRALSWRDFERLARAAYEARGYSVQETSAGADGGVDLIALRDGQTTFVQCKHWRTQQVGVERVRELYGVVAARRAHKGVFITTGRLTEAARRWADEVGIEVIDEDSIEAFLGHEKLLPQHEPTRITLPQDEPASAGPDQPLASPSCPRCGHPMVERMARRGTNAGQTFWGCSRFPACRGTLPGVSTGKAS